MNYSLIIGLVSFISAGAITVLTVLKDKADKNEADIKNNNATQELQSAKNTIVALQEKAHKQSTVYHQESAKSMDSLNRQQQTLIKEQERVINLQQENQRKAEKLNTLQSQIINEITGGDSYCRLNINIVPNYLDKTTKYLELITIENLGNYPLKDIQITLEKPQLKWDKALLNGYASSNNDQSLNFSFFLPSLSQRTKFLLYHRPISDDQIIRSKITYVATIVLRKGIYNQVIKLAQYKNVWLDASKLFSPFIKDFNPIINVHPYFPNKNLDGTIDWTIIEN